jgi:hypothetical protein
VLGPAPSRAAARALRARGRFHRAVPDLPQPHLGRRPADDGAVRARQEDAELPGAAYD